MPGISRKTLVKDLEGPVQVWALLSSGHLTQFFVACQEDCNGLLAAFAKWKGWRAEMGEGHRLNPMFTAYVDVAPLNPDSATALAPVPLSVIDFSAFVAMGMVLVIKQEPVDGGGFVP